MRTPCFHILSYSTLSFIPCLSLFLFLFLSLPYHPSPFCSIFTIHQFCCSCLYIFSAFRCRLNAIWNTLSQSHLISGDALWFTILPEYDTVDVFSYHWVPSEDTNALFMFCVFFTVLYYFCFISFMCLVNTDGTSLLKKISCFLLWYCLGVMTASTVTWTDGGGFCGGRCSSVHFIYFRFFLVHSSKRTLPSLPWIYASL